ncbi:cyclin-dependent kinase inhibitor 3 family protein [Shimia sp. NS0008-38b]
MGLELFEMRFGRGRLALSAMPGLHNSLAHDLAAIVTWRADLVISLVEQVELASAAAADLPELLHEAGVAWQHFPIRDYDIPDAAGTVSWQGLCQRALDILGGGGRVLVHCRGGCGRSGMVALKLMVASGLPSGEALSRLRDVRPCAVETDPQMVWATEGRIHKA